jgi:Flp pilus assembly secretin CpaC
MNVSQSSSLSLARKLRAPLSFLLFAIPSQILAATLNLGIGQQEVLTFDALAKSASVDRTGIIDVAKGETKSVILVTGKSEGSASLKISLDDGKTVVYDVNVARNTKNTFSNMLNRLRRAPGISIENQNNKFIVSGQFRNRSDQLILQAALRDYPGLIVDTTDPEIVESNAVVKAINRVLADNDIGNLQAHAYGQIIALEGSPKNDTQKALALRIARIISPGIEDHVSTDSNGAPAIAIEVLFIEASKTNSKTYGISGPQAQFAGKSQTTDDGFVSGTASGFNAERVLGARNLSWHVGSLSAFLKLQQAKGSSRVVSNPKLIARSGQKASFESGGAFYLPQESAGSDGVRTKTYTQQATGIQLAIEPRIDTIGQIDSKIKATITDVAEKAPDAPPTLTKSNLETAVTIPSGQSILLSGLTMKKAVKNISRVPLLADIPIVGELFKVRDQSFIDKEVAVIVTMKRVAPTDNRAQVADQLLDTSDDDVSFSFFD